MKGLIPKLVMALTCLSLSVACNTANPTPTPTPPPINPTADRTSTPAPTNQSVAPSNVPECRTKSSEVVGIDSSHPTYWLLVVNFDVITPTQTPATEVGH